MSKEINQDNLFEEVLSFLRERTDDPSVIMTALAKTMTVVLLSSQLYYGDPNGVKETAKELFNNILKTLN